MAASNLVVRTGVGSWASIKYLITRGLDIGVVTSPWTQQNDVSTTWTQQTDDSSTWTAQTDESTTWTDNG